MHIILWNLITLFLLLTTLNNIAFASPIFLMQQWHQTLHL